MQEAFPIGTFLDAVKVVKVEAERGILVDTLSGLRGFVHVCPPHSSPHGVSDLSLDLACIRRPCPSVVLVIGSLEGWNITSRTRHRLLSSRWLAATFDAPNSTGAEILASGGCPTRGTYQRHSQEADRQCAVRLDVR